MTAPGPSPGAGSGSTGPSGKEKYPPPDVPPVRQTPPPSHVGGEAKPPTRWPLSIVVFLLFWFILGAIAMYYSSQVNARWRSGDVAGAKQASKTALIVNLIGIGVGLLFWILVIAAGS
ncbi:CD225/dispanin family protein [Streptomyces lydicus]|uniref:CD225/dispanin family protein n=1 Tax=Streptomyces lydicus TaxID=47763 RepID=UPI0037003D2C